ncbi:MAG: hypothetical protein ACYS6I_01520 [Planctomycetota bacterium]|jgi:hypothetical protein
MKKIKIFKILLFLLLVTIFWFLAVDASLFIETCRDCFFYREDLQFRLFTFPIFKKEFVQLSSIIMVARDLGVACEHPNLKRWHKTRMWGLIFRGFPCINGTTVIAWDSKSYDKGVTDRLNSLVESDPQLPQEFQQRVLIERDMEYWHSLRNKVFPQKSDEPQEVGNMNEKQ